MTLEDDFLLAQTLARIMAIDPSIPIRCSDPTICPGSYHDRNRLVYQALAIAQRGGMVAGIGIDPAAPAWPVVYIELPTGQVSWHLPAHPIAYDGHSTLQKADRIIDYLESRALPDGAPLHPVPPAPGAGTADEYSH